MVAALHGDAVAACSRATAAVLYADDDFAVGTVTGGGRPAKGGLVVITGAVSCVGVARG